MLRAAVVGGAAYHAGKRVQEGRDADYDRDARMDELEQQQAMQQQMMQQQQAAASPAPAGGITDDAIAQIQKLGELKTQGLLSDEEFEAQKRKLLGT
ncbi:MAG TPA: SHOCT domain-containing protein [Gaiellaceae bacterium]|nr:SHOCT domain-containing protein [Gaiellaceae bacterium]